MTSVDNSTFLPNGGYLQKGREKNIRAKDLGNKAHYLAPSRWYRDEKIFQLEKRALFSTVRGRFRSCFEYRLWINTDLGTQQQLWHVASFISRFQKAGDYLSMNVRTDRGANMQLYSFLSLGAQ